MMPLNIKDIINGLQVRKKKKKKKKIIQKEIKVIQISHINRFKIESKIFYYLLDKI